MRLLALLVALGSALIAVQPISANCVFSNRSVGQGVGYDAIGILWGAGMADSGRQGLVTNAMGQWNNSDCNVDGSSFPRFQLGSQGVLRVITIDYQPGFDPENDRRCGVFQGNRIVLFESARDPAGRVQPCARSDIFFDSAVHEFGHALGLDDSPCPDFGMSQVGFTSAGAYVDRRLDTAECHMVAETMKTPTETTEEICRENPGDSRCEDWQCEINGCTSPIVIDLGGDGLAFTNSSAGVSFDLDGDGQRERTAWVKRNSRDGFLVFDRNGNGIVDNGSELFGNKTPYFGGGVAGNGFEALFEMDALFGNGNSVVEPSDPYYSWLGVWVDMDEDGVTDHGELVPLAAARVERIELEYTFSVGVDKYGSSLRYVSRAIVDGAMVEAVDVFLRRRE